MNKTRHLRAVLLCSALAISANAFAQSKVIVPAGCKDGEDVCVCVNRLAAEAYQKKVEDIKTTQAENDKRISEQNSCLQRAQDSIVRAAIPPSLGSILGALADPVGMIKTAVSNAACNVVTDQANQVTRGINGVQSTVRGAASGAQYGVAGAVNGALGGQAGNIYGQPPADDKPFLQSFACRVFGRC